MNERTHDEPSPAAQREHQQEHTMDLLIGYLLMIGVLTSVVLIAAGLLWRWIATGRPVMDYAIQGVNLAEFVIAEARLALSGQFRPRLLVNLGLVVLMLTPFARVLASVLFFAFAERNWKYTLITLFVLLVLSYSLFLR
jgi:uncharacterized membrane protein